MESHAQLPLGLEHEVSLRAVRKIGLPTSQACFNILPFLPPLQFPMSSIELILEKLKEEESKSREIRLVFIAADCKHRKMVDYNTFR